MLYKYGLAKSPTFKRLYFYLHTVKLLFFVDNVQVLCWAISFGNISPISGFVIFLLTIYFDKQNILILMNTNILF